MAIIRQNKARIYKDFDLSFTKNAITGDLNKKIDSKAVKQSMYTLVQTQMNERPFHPELGSDIAENGMVLTGGGALLKNLDRLLQEETGIPVIIAEDPLTCVARGCGKTLDQLDYFKNTFVYE